MHVGTGVPISVRLLVQSMQLVLLNDEVLLLLLLLLLLLHLVVVLLLPQLLHVNEIAFML